MFSSSRLHVLSGGQKSSLTKKINIIALEDKDEGSVTMEFKSMTLNEAARFRFKMSSGYKEIEIK